RKIAELYLSCLAENPDDRPSAATAAAVVQVALTVRTPQPRDVVPRGGLPDDDTESLSLGAIADADRRRRRRKALALAAGLAVVLLAGALAFSYNPGKHPGVTTSSQTPAPFGKGFGHPGDPDPSPTDAPPGDVPGATRPGREVPVHGVPQP